MAGRHRAPAAREAPSSAAAARRAAVTAATVTAALDAHTRRRKSGRRRVPVPGDGGRVPVPGVPLWVAHAVVEYHEPGSERLAACVRVGRCRLLLWRAGCALVRLVVGFWRSLYVREDRHAGEGGGTNRAPRDNREVRDGL